MDPLQENLNEILEEKNNNITPENLRAGVTAFGVTGVFEGGGLNVKEFESLEEMLQSSDNVAGDVAFVYKSGYRDMEGTDVISKFYIPKRVVLPEPLTNTYQNRFSGNLFQNNDSVFSADSSTVSISFTGSNYTYDHMGTGPATRQNISISYTSSDGITYTTTNIMTIDPNGGEYTVSTALNVTLDETSPTAFAIAKRFIQIPSRTLDKIFIYNGEMWEEIQKGEEQTLFEVVEQLPETGAENIIYLVPNGGGNDGEVLPANCSSMFEEESFETFDGSNYDTSNVTNMEYMFAGCSSLTSINLSMWDTSNVGNMRYMFAGCTSLQHVDLRNWNLTDTLVQSGMLSSMFTQVPANCEVLVSTQTFKNVLLNTYSCSHLTNIQVREGGGSSSKNMYDEYVFKDGIFEKIGSTSVVPTNEDILVKGDRGTGVKYIHAASENPEIANGNVPFGEHAFVMGENCAAQGRNAFAEGRDTEAIGVSSHAEGYNTYAEGTYSHSEGYNTHARGEASHAEGYNTYANSAYQHVAGKFNITDDNNTYVEIIGNGVYDPSNARTLDWDGNGWYAGKLTVGAGPVNNMDVATKEYVDNMLADLSNTNAVKYFNSVEEMEAGDVAVNEIAVVCDSSFRKLSTNTPPSKRVKFPYTVEMEEGFETDNCFIQTQANGFDEIAMSEDVEFVYVYAMARRIFIEEANCYVSASIVYESPSLENRRTFTRSGVNIAGYYDKDTDENISYNGPAIDFGTSDIVLTMKDDVYVDEYWDERFGDFVFVESNTTKNVYLKTEAGFKKLTQDETVATKEYVDNMLADLSNTNAVKYFNSVEEMEAGDVAVNEIAVVSEKSLRELEDNEISDNLYFVESFTLDNVVLLSENHGINDAYFMDIQNLPSDIVLFEGYPIKTPHHRIDVNNPSQILYHYYEMLGPVHFDSISLSVDNKPIVDYIQFRFKEGEIVYESLDGLTFTLSKCDIDLFADNIKTIIGLDTNIQYSEESDRESDLELLRAMIKVQSNIVTDVYLKTEAGFKKLTQDETVATKEYVDTLIGDLETALDTLSTGSGV